MHSPENLTNLGPAETAADLAATGPAAAAAAPGSRPEGGLLAGRYALGELLGEGGMGTVFRAEQVLPVKRPVAVKLIKPGMDSARVVARFEAERQALALMEHPNIARVLDGGTTDRGQPFFVMELVNGLPLTAYCDQKRLSVRQRLDLFVLVCRAVEHAHQKGVMHRDLKPSNILVAEVDGKPVPKVIDFGLAKALQAGALPELSLDGALGSLLGTPLYMAPEQANPDTADIDTRADIYALGVVLYELLVGSTPVTRATFLNAALGEMLRLVREGDTPPPTARLRAAPDLPNIAAVRSTEPARLAREVRGDLEWIAMKCLEKDRRRRYETANGLADDVLRHLADEPVTAGRPSRWYKARKFVRRNRGPVFAASLVLLALVGGIVGTSLGLFRALTAERMTAKALADSEVARTQATAVADYLVDAFRKPDPSEDGRQLKVVDLLEKAADKLAVDKDMDALTRARLQDTLAQTFFGLGLPEKAAALQEQALVAYQSVKGADNPETLGVMHRLSYSLGHANRHAEAIQVGEEVLARRKAVLGPDHPDTLLTMTQLAGRYWSVNRLDDAISMAEQALAGQRKLWGPDHNDLPNSITNLGMLYQAAGHIAEAVKLHEEAVAMRKAAKGVDHADTLLAINFLGQAYKQAGRTADAIALQRDTVAQMESKFGPDHTRTLAAMSKLAQTYYSAGKGADALQVCEKALKLAKAAKTPDTAAVLQAMQDLAMAYSYVNRKPESLTLLREVVTTAKAKYGPNHDTTLTAMHDLGVALRRADKPAEALDVLEQVFAVRKSIRSEDDKGLQVTITQLASAYEAVGRPKQAIPLLEKLLAVQKAKLDPDHTDLLVTMANLGLSYGSAGRTRDAVRVHEQVAAAFQKKFGPAHPDTKIVIGYLAKAYKNDNRLDAAETTYRNLLKSTRPSLPAESPDLADTFVGLGEVLLAARKFAEAEGSLREGLTIREKKMPDNWRTFHTKSMLGAAVAGQKRYAEAEPLLVGGYEGLKKCAEKIPGSQKALLSEAAERLTRLYKAWEKPEK
jgi:serine/threonine protein kinase/tetratricopeptide (TPR) repeat protein